MPQRSDTLHLSLPDPPPGRTGWPWTAPEPAPRPSAAPAFADEDYPTITIVTPSFNQAEYIEETIRSVLLQGYPNLEYLVIDGGSTDGSADVIRRYERHLAYWVSEPDRGQSHAINKGLARATGDVVAYLNSDDYYLPGTLHAVAEAFMADPDLAWVTGTGEYFTDAEGAVRHMRPVRNPSLVEVMTPWKGPQAIAASQVSNFLRRRVYETYGFFDESLHYAMDFDFGLRLHLDGIWPRVLDRTLGRARLHPQSKTVSKSGEGLFRADQYQVIERHLPRVPEPDRSRVRWRLRHARFIDGLSAAVNHPGGRWEGLKALLRCLLRYPEYAWTRPAAGALRRLLFEPIPRGTPP